MTDLDRWQQCESKTRIYVPTGEKISGHNWARFHAYIDDGFIQFMERCKWCGDTSTWAVPYNDETPEQIYAMYGYKLDDESGVG